MLLFLKRLLVRISMVSSREMLVKSEPISKLPMRLLESYSTISVANLKESLTVYFSVVNNSKIDTKYFVSLYVGVCKADKIGLRGGQPSTHFFMHFKRILHYSRYNSHWFQISSCFFRHAVRVNKLYINFINVFFLTGNKVQKILIFYSSFLKFALIT